MVEQKIRLGDLEVDTIIGNGHQGAIVTLNCRATGVLKMKLVPTREARLVSEAVIALLQAWKPLLHTITADNGRTGLAIQFSFHQKISEALAIDVYFAKPYHAWQRGANENLNGLVRQYIPKQTDFSTLSPTRVKEIQDKINQRPRCGGLEKGIILNPQTRCSLNTLIKN